MLLDRGISVNHTDDLKQTALFYAARQGHAQTCKWLIANGADPDHLDINGNTARFYANVLALNMLVKDGHNAEGQDHRKRSMSSMSDAGPALKRQRLNDEVATRDVKKLREWANEWPVRGRAAGKTLRYKAEDVIKEANGFAVVGKAPPSIAARLRVSEKNFVIDHAKLLATHPWFKDVSREEWCSKVGVLPDKSDVDAVNTIKAVLAGDNPLHFTLPIVEVKTKRIAGYVHAAHNPEMSELNIAHLKVDEGFRGQGLGGLLIEAAEDKSMRMGWKCCRTTLSVLEVNAAARRCYFKAGFNVQSVARAFLGSRWLNLTKVHKHHGF